MKISAGGIRALVREKQYDQAIEQIGLMLADVTGEKITNVRINFDQYSLNSLNGFATMGKERELFFKFHQEEGEEDTVEEYYNARILQDAGYRVTVPVFQRSVPGQQIVIYDRVSDPRLSDVCSAIEQGKSTVSSENVVAAQIAADRQYAAIAINSLKYCDDITARSQPVMQLFYNRLVDNPQNFSDQKPGGRLRRFYLEGQVEWPGLSAPFAHIWQLPWQINGIDYRFNLKQCFEQAMINLSPARLIPGPVITAHGDAHNANVWYCPSKEGEPAGLSLFDPAFASAQMPALLAEVKASFHNIFAHPFWLYEADIALEKYSANIAIKNDRICVETDYCLSPLRQQFLDSKAENFWAPLLNELDQRGWLADDWEQIVRSGLFACPTLVMNLLAGDDTSHNPTSSLIGFCQAIRAASPPVNDETDMFVQMFDAIRKAM